MIDGAYKVIGENPDSWDKKASAILGRLQNYNSALFTAGELAWLAHELYGRVKFITDEQGVIYLEQLTALEHDILERKQ